jgi:hypothetical protein
MEVVHVIISNSIKVLLLALTMNLFILPVKLKRDFDHIKNPLYFETYIYYEVASFVYTYTLPEVA